MNGKLDISAKATGVALALALGSAILSLHMASADELDSVGSFEDGAAVGQRNGGLIAERVYKKVINRQGCDGVVDFQQALQKVIGGVKAPVGEGSAFTAGFYSGYLDAVKAAIKSARAACGISQFDDGSYPGSLFGGAFCQVAAQAEDSLADLAFGPIYDGWSASSEVSDQCIAAFKAQATDCVEEGGIAAQLLEGAAAAACAQ